MLCVQPPGLTDITEPGLDHCTGQEHCHLSLGLQLDTLVSFLQFLFWQCDILKPIMFKGNVYGCWGIKGGLDWVKTWCLVITIHFKPLRYQKNFNIAENLRGILDGTEEFLRGISAGTEELIWGISAGTEEFLMSYLGRDGKVFMKYLGQDRRVFMRYLCQDGSFYVVSWLWQNNFFPAFCGQCLGTVVKTTNCNAWYLSKFVFFVKKP